MTAEWSGKGRKGESPNPALSFSSFLSHFLPFLSPPPAREWQASKREEGGERDLICLKPAEARKADVEGIELCFCVRKKSAWMLFSDRAMYSNISREKYRANFLALGCFVNGQFVYSLFRQLGTTSACCIANLLFHQLAVWPTQLGISSTYSYMNLTFHQPGISSM